MGIFSLGFFVFFGNIPSGFIMVVYMDVWGVGVKVQKSDLNLFVSHREKKQADGHVRIEVKIELGRLRS